MKACPVCLVECSDDYDYCPIDGIALLPFVVVDGPTETDLLADDDVFDAVGTSSISAAP